jgi:hypothetical protein
MDAFSYKLGDTGTVLNPNDTSVLPFVDITKVSGLDSPEFRTTERDHEGTDGGFLDAEFEKMRTLTLEGQVIGGSDAVEALLDQLKANWAPRRTSIPFYYSHPGASDRVIFVKPLGVRFDYDTLRRIGSCDVQFMCQAEDPRIYDAVLQTLNLAQGAAITTGIAFSLDLAAPGFSFGAAADPNQTNVYNGGNRPSPAVITIPGPVTNPIIYNDTTSNVLQFQIDVAGGDSLVIDLAYRTVKLNGSVSRRATLLAPDWFLLQPGDNFLRYRANTVGGTAATVAFRNAWR